MANVTGASDKTTVQKGGKPMQVKVRNVTRAMTTGTLVATLPRGSRILYFIISGTASDAGTTATLSIGNNTTATQFVSAASVLSGGQGNGVNMLVGVTGAVGAAQNSPSQADLPIFVKYAETGTASAAGAWKVYIHYTTGNVTNDDTI